MSEPLRPRVVHPFSVQRSHTVTFINIERMEKGNIRWSDVSGEVDLTPAEFAAVIEFLKGFVA